MSNKKVLMLALICGLLTAVALNFYLRSIEQAATNTKLQKVIVAAARIPERALVTADMVVFKDVPVEYVHRDAVTDAGQVIGNTTRAEIEAGEQILYTKLVPKKDTGSTMAYSIPLGMRAISIAVNEQSGVAGLITPGDRVDVMGTVDGEIPNIDPNASPKKSTKTHLILQNVLVLAVGRNYSEPKPAADNAKDKKEQNQGGTGTVTLAVPADEMQFLVAVGDKGKLTLALRAPADKSQEDRLSVDSLEYLK